MTLYQEEEKPCRDTGVVGEGESSWNVGHLLIGSFPVIGGCLNHSSTLYMNMYPWAKKCSKSGSLLVKRYCGVVVCSSKHWVYIFSQQPVHHGAGPLPHSTGESSYWGSPSSRKGTRLHILMGGVAKGL